MSAQSQSAYRFEGKTIKLNQRDYDQWKKVYHAIPDFDAELQRIDDSELPANWFCAVSAKLAAKHQKFKATEASSRAPGLQAYLKPQPSLASYVSVMKLAYRDNKRWLAPSNKSIVQEAYAKGLITAAEAEFCGWRP
jgi:hypothetical protein